MFEGMYHAIVRRRIEALFAAVNKGNAEPVLASFAPRFEHAFLGEHALGGARFRYLQNVDDPAQFLIEVEYEADAALELNRQKVASDPMVRTFLQGWRQMLAGTADMDVYEDVTG